MGNLKNRAKSVFCLFLAINFLTTLVHAETGKRSFYLGNSDLFVHDDLHYASSSIAAEPGRPIFRKPRLRSEKVALEILAGLAGNVLFGGFSVSLFVRIFPDGSESFVPASAVVGYSTGSLFGSALGVCLVGNSCGARGKAGSAFFGSFLGELAAVGATLLSRYNAGVYLLTTVILPVVGATILFNKSLRENSFPAGNALLNISSGRLGLGVPDVRVRPIFAPGCGSKPELQFNVNILSVEI